MNKAEIEYTKQIKDKITEFLGVMKKFNVVINPYESLRHKAEETIKLGHCPCVATRLHCPCEELESDFKELGRCKCKFFMTKDYVTEIVGWEYDERTKPKENKDKKNI